MTDTPDLLDQGETLSSLPPTIEAMKTELAVSQADAPPAVTSSGDAAMVMSMMTQLVMSGEMTSEKVAALEQLSKLQESMEDRQASRTFQRAFVQMQKHLPRIKRDGRLEYPVDSKKPDGPMKLVSKFAKWETLMEGIQPILSEHGFAISFKSVPRPGDGGGLGVCAVLRHEDGHIETGEPFYVSLDTSGGKNNAQAYRSSASYGQRGAATLALNIVTEGDDNDAKDLTGEVKRLSEEQLDQLTAKLGEAGINPDAFLKTHTDAAEFDQVPAESFVRLMNRIDSIKRQQSGKEQRQ